MSKRKAVIGTVVMASANALRLAAQLLILRRSHQGPDPFMRCPRRQSHPSQNIHPCDLPALPALMFIIVSGFLSYLLAVFSAFARHLFMTCSLLKAW